ncbi:MAG: DUF2304 domain-containing protein, partial [Lachnospiraceae bacterium]|nr:DUF2304 domain-containing protein [Lachnospiraceae bacterium]
MQKLQMIAALILLAGMFYLIHMMRKRKLDIKYALSWMLMITVMLVVDLFPPILSLISYLFGIATPVNTLFFLGFIFSLVLIFVLTVSVSRLSERIRQLSQAMALLEQKVR